MEEQPIRVAQIIGKWLGGGVEAVLMNYYREIDKTKIQFDFICDNDSTNIPYEESMSTSAGTINFENTAKLVKEEKTYKI